MAPQHWQAVKAILGEALEREDEKERTAYVDETCADAPELRQEVETLLRVSGDKMEECAEHLRRALLNRIWSQPIGRRLGAYRLMGEIGRGGMGAVFLAERADGQFEKEVAIKLLKRGTDTDEILRRFQAERQILARLDHPSIARLLDAGTSDDGLPYFVMEFISGVPVTRYVEQKNLSLPVRLDLFLKICAAVECAHRNSVVHRDLKPSNILITSEGEPKLLDFGIAKLLDAAHPSDATLPQQNRLTPSYASPEQARGEPVSFATDIYSLGALLYEMLAARPAYQFPSPPPSFDQVARILESEPPVAPSLVAVDVPYQRQLRGDLDNIVLCAMRFEPLRRYPSVAAFAEDIRRYLTARPVDARPNTVTYRARRFLARNRTALVPGLSVAALFTAAGISAAVYFHYHAPSRTTIASTVTAAPTPVSKKSIAVLPFESIGSPAPPAYFVDGVQDDILTDLARISDLKVMSHGAVAPYRGTKKDARDIGRALGVAHVLEGSVQKSGDRVRVNARLIDTGTNSQVWADHYDRKVQDLFGLQSELAQVIVAQLKVKLSPSERAALEKKPTEDMEAYDLYLEARQAISQFGGENGKNWRTADKLLDSAIARDPNFTLAYCLKSKADILLYRYFDRTPARLQEAKAAADTAREQAPRLGEPHLALATYYYHGFRDYKHAQAELDLAAPTMGGNAEFLSLAQITERRLGHWKQAVRDGEKALSLDPNNAVYASTLIQSYHVLRKFDEVQRVADASIPRLPEKQADMLWQEKEIAALESGDTEKARQIANTAPSPNMWKDSALIMIAFYERDFAKAARIAEAKELDTKNDSDYLIEGDLYRRLGESEKAVDAFQKARDMLKAELAKRPDDCLLLGSLALSYAGLNQKQEAIATARRAAALFPLSQDAIDGANAILNLAEVYTMTGERGAAIDELSRIVQTPTGATFGELSLNPTWDPLRDDPRFAELLKRAAKPLVFE